jgi:hypothetical protein
LNVENRKRTENNGRAEISIGWITVGSRCEWDERMDRQTDRQQYKHLSNCSARSSPVVQIDRLD